MNGDVRISVITVVKNDACHLEETILSVIEIKARVALEYIVIDGGSTDGTTDVIRNYADHISYWVSEKDNGIYDAMNKGWAIAAEDSFILFIGAGDKIISLPQNMGSYSLKNVIYGTVLMGENTIFKARADFHLKLYNSLHHQALLVNKSLNAAPPFNCNYPVFADFDFNQRLMKKGACFVYAPEFVGYASSGGVSDRSYFSESLRVVFANFGFLWAAAAVLGYYAMRFLPLLKSLRPIQER